ncbi:hypothetical protein MKX03_015764 [Papaver bracteatum]|nr:hypothetical protein MKX03_015764 [Papaver bracteatum]
MFYFDSHQSFLCDPINVRLAKKKIHLKIWVLPHLSCHITIMPSYYISLFLKFMLQLLYKGIIIMVCIKHQLPHRWHNYLNPNINKEAWTQEEEAALIHAHQIYGNKCAELTKFLPRRYTDNMIKNHWHSSVKNKLQGPPHVGNPNQYPPCTLRAQNNGRDDSFLKDRSKMEEVSRTSDPTKGHVGNPNQYPPCSSEHKIMVEMIVV